jgi:predicted metal-dependent hydrolase
MKFVYLNGIIIFIIFVIICVINRKKDVIYVVSDINNKSYLVRDLIDKQSSCNLLAKINNNILLFVNYLKNNIEKYSEYEQYIKQLTVKIKHVVISETDNTSIYTSYSVNKGEQIIFCLRSKKNKDILHDLNLIMYVVIHELAHVGCPEYGHTKLFKKIFAFFTEIAIEIKLYKKIDFSFDPHEYCGLMITDSII